jgi:hypothetical protein
LPISAKPDGIITAPAIFFCPTSSIAAATNFAGIAKMATSMSAGHVEHARVALAAEDLLGLRVNRVDVARVAAVDQVAHDRVADLPLLGRRADDRDRARSQDAPHRREDVFTRDARRARRGLEVEQHAYVGSRRAFLGDEQRVEVDLMDLREVGDEARDPLNDRGQTLAVGRLRATHAAQDTRRRQIVEHRRRFGRGHRRKPERHVTEHFDEDPAEPEHHELAERRVAHTADDHLGAATRHLLNLHALDARLLRVPARALRDLVVGGAQLAVVLHADAHRAGLGLVQHVRRDDLERDRIADLQRELHGLRRRGGDAGLRRRNTVRRTQLGRFYRPERRAPSFARGGQELSHCGLVGLHGGLPSTAADRGRPKRSWASIRCRASLRFASAGRQQPPRAAARAGSYLWGGDA